MPPEPAWASHGDGSFVLRFRSTIFSESVVPLQKSERLVREKERMRLGRAPRQRAPATAVYAFQFAAAPTRAVSGWVWPDVEVRPHATKGHALYARRDISPGLMLPFLGDIISRNPDSTNSDFVFEEDGFGVRAHGNPPPAVCSGKRCAVAFVNEPGMDERECINCMFLKLPAEGLEGYYGNDAFRSPSMFLVVALPVAQGEELLAWYGDAYSDAADGDAHGETRTYLAAERYADDDDFARRVNEVASTLAFVHAERVAGREHGVDKLVNVTRPPLRPFDVYAIGLLAPRDYGFRVAGDCFYEAYAFALKRDTSVLDDVDGLDIDVDGAREGPFPRWILPLRAVVADRLRQRLHEDAYPEGLPGGVRNETGLYGHIRPDLVTRLQAVTPPPPEPRSFRQLPCCPSPLAGT
jgi:hypothetical protein